MEIKPYGESALIIQFENEVSLKIHQQVKSWYKHLLSINIKGVLSIIPAYTSITILFDSKHQQFSSLKELLVSLDIPTIHHSKSKIVEIPVCYDEQLGIDINEVSQSLGLSIKEIIQYHTSTTYTVYMLGFSPGFMYLGGLAPQLFIPRKKVPRLKIPAGAVGLADKQTGIYPQATPGGWQIIGQTPISIFSVNKSPLIQMGDQVKFKPIDLSTYQQLKSE
ncbi:5-oxoprolinase subunit PxpB [Flammeovirga agarivorans]|uniref:5-oxoprolinase subunit PxpB n=1 Tax=Flammeovirga agarivorans TaxID=2726742 RepID=A0A7X8SMT7_9BACT|nr:5-oxoprolinase subunit PxpB [Flammeovirga agarivorans]NLR93111.1 5-oxoprolinase subunit PxpB [Flammeovirga agarivorans]